MLISDKQRAMSWQIRTNDGNYFQPESLDKLYMWIFENRITAEDFIFSAHVNDWILVPQMPELAYCFWKLLASGDVVYGPLSAGELKQLYLNDQINSDSKVALYNGEDWKEIHDLPVLNKWLESRDEVVIDYVQLIEKFQNEYLLVAHKEKDNKDLKKIKKETVVEKKYITELQSAKQKIEKELADKTKELDTVKTNYISLQKELKNLKTEMDSKNVQIEELNKQTAQTEIAYTLKDDEIKQLQANIKSLKDEIENTGREKGQDETDRINKVYELNGKIEKLSKENEGLMGLADELRGVIAERERALNALNSGKTEYILELETEINAKKNELDYLRRTVEELNTNISAYKENTENLRNEIVNKDKFIQKNNNSLANYEQMVKEKTKEVTELQLVMQEKSEELLSYSNIINKLQNSLQEKESEIESLRGIISENSEKLQIGNSEKDSIISDLRERMALIEKDLLYYKDSFAKTQSESAEKDGIIRQYKEDAQRLEISASEKEFVISESKKKISVMEAEQRDYKEGNARLLGESAEKDSAINQYKSDIEKMRIDGEERESILSDLRGKISVIEGEIAGYKESLVQMQSELAEKDRQILELDNIRSNNEALLNENIRKIDTLNNNLTEKENVLIQRGEYIKKAEEDKSLLENKIVELRQNVEILQDRYNTKAREWEAYKEVQVQKFNDELSEKENKWARLLMDSEEKWRKVSQDLETALEERNMHVEQKDTEIAGLRDDLINQNTIWQGRLDKAKDEMNRISEDLYKQIEVHKAEFTEKMSRLLEENNILNANILDLEKTHRETIKQRDDLRQTIAERDAFIESIKKEADDQRKDHFNAIQELEQKLNHANLNADTLNSRIEELENKIQINLSVEEGLRKNISLLNEEMADANRKIDQINKEKQDAIVQFENYQEDFNRLKSGLEGTIEELKRNLEHSVEENKDIQRQFYLEKQKLTKEYNETLNKQEKLYKRSQLEREIQDRAKMKDELEKLYSLLRANFEGLQQGATEIQTTIQNVGSDIDNKRLSLKYLVETEKREEKRGQMYKTEPAEESDSSSQQ